MVSKESEIEESTGLYRSELEYFKSILSPEEFREFTSIIGTEKVGFVPEDFEEIYYPEVNDGVS